MNKFPGAVMLSAEDGAYTSQLPFDPSFFLSHLDWAWFFVLLGWALVLMLWWNGARRDADPSWRWVPAAAAGGVATAMVVFTDLTGARLGESPREAYQRSDVALCMVVGATAMGCAWQSGQRAAGRTRWLLWLLMLPPAAAVAYCGQVPPNGGQRLLGPASIALTAAAFLAVVPALVQRGATLYSRTCALLVALAPVASTVGPLASVVFFMRHRYSPLTPLCFGWAAVHVMLASLCLLGLARTEWRRRSAMGRRELWHDGKLFAAAAAAWIALGCWGAAFVGTRQRRSADEHALDFARLAAAQVARTPVSELVAPRFHLDNIVGSGGPARLAVSRHLLSGVEEKVRPTMQAVASGSRTMSHVRLVTLRDGWLVGIVGYTAPFLGSAAHVFGGVSLDPKFPPGRTSRGHVLLARRATPNDLAAWADRAASVEGPVHSRIFASPVMLARAPVLAADRRMLGWMEFTYQADAYLAHTAQARIAPLIGALSGGFFIAAAFGQRRRSRAHEETLVALRAARIKTEFLATVSHELRTPLQTIIGYAQLLEHEVDSEPARRHLAAQRSQTELMLRLVDDLLELNAAEHGSFRLVESTISLHTVVAEAIETLRPRAEAKRLVLRLTAAPDLPDWVTADPGRLRQIVHNLAGNAIKYTDRGRVDIALGVRSNQGPLVEVELTVTDTGPGIAAADQARLFQPFSRVERKVGITEGFGLGLAVVAALCRKAGGSVEVESEPGRGACFRVRLPLPISQPPAAASPALPSSLRGQRFLIVDDNPLVREIFRTFLERQGASCDVAAGGEEALERVSTQPYDAALVDLEMPKTDGAQVARELRRIMGPLIRIVGISAHAGETDQKRALNAGMNAFLAKPVDFSQLAAALATDPRPDNAVPTCSLTSEVAELFRADIENQRVALDRAIRDEDWDELRRVAHYLKNSAAAIGDEALHQTSAVLETAAERRQLDLARAATKAMHQNLERW